MNRSLFVLSIALIGLATGLSAQAVKKLAAKISTDKIATPAKKPVAPVKKTSQSS